MKSPTEMILVPKYISLFHEEDEEEAIDFFCTDSIDVLQEDVQGWVNICLTWLQDRTFMNCSLNLLPLISYVHQVGDQVLTPTASDILMAMTCR